MKMDVKPKGRVYKIKRVKKQGTFDEQSMSTVPDTWRRTLDENYSIFRDNLVQPRKVAEHIPITKGIKKEMDDMLDDHQRTDHLVKRVLPNGPKSWMDDFKTALKLTGQEHLIPYVPGDQGVKRSLSVDSGIKEPNNVPADDCPVMIHVNGHKYLKLMQVREKPVINLREYIIDMDGKLHPTKKGILLSLDDWQALKNVDISALMVQKKTVI